jgi:hypothetical protein
MEKGGVYGRKVWLRYDTVRVETGTKIKKTIASWI